MFLLLHALCEAAMGDRALQCSLCLFTDDNDFSLFHLTYAGEGNMKLHCCVAAYVSDYAFLGTAMLPYPNFRAKFSASLDHAMWFHSTFRTDEWMLYECESPWAGQ